MANYFKFRTKLWLYNAPQAAWHFLTIPKKESKTMHERFGAMSRGWGSLKVEVTVGETSWKTSIFPDKKLGAYVLPVKADVRKREGLSVGDIVRYEIEILV